MNIFKITHFFNKAKDGGSESPVDAYFLIEIKGLFSIAVLKFNEGRRESFHTHAFTAWTWFLKGNLEEEKFDGTKIKYTRNFIPKLTKNIAPKKKNDKIFDSQISAGYHRIFHHWTVNNW